MGKRRAPGRASKGVERAAGRRTLWVASGVRRRRRHMPVFVIDSNSADRAGCMLAGQLVGVGKEEKRRSIAAAAAAAWE